MTIKKKSFVLNLLLVTTILLTTTAFVAPFSSGERVVQAEKGGGFSIEGFDCYGYVCWWETLCAAIPPGLNQWYHCTNWCMNIVSGTWSCQGTSWCGGPCD